MLVIVSNDNARTVVSLSVVWHVTNREGRTSQYSGARELSGGDLRRRRPQPRSGRAQDRGAADEANGIWDPWVGPSGRVPRSVPRSVRRARRTRCWRAPSTSAYRAQRRHLRRRPARLVLDDQSTLTDLFATYVQAKQDWYRGILEALDAGQSVAESFAPVERFFKEGEDRLRAGSDHPGEKAADMWTYRQRLTPHARAALRGRGSSGTAAAGDSARPVHRPPRVARA